MAVAKSGSVKRKSIEPSEQILKKVKIAKSADRPAPLKSALKPSKTQASVHEDEEDDSDDDALTPDQTAALLAGFSSSDEDEQEEDRAGIALSKLPKPPSNAKISVSGVEGLSKDNKEDLESTPGVVYVGRLPHGFYERQMRAYFSQFGEITHLKMPRNKKTGRSKHYAFIEFASAAVADIVSKTMDKYLLFNHILRVQRISKEHVKENMWKGEGKRKRPMPRNKIEGAQLRKGTDVDGWSRRVQKELERRRSKADKLKELGYELEMPLVTNVPLPVLDTPTLERGAEQQLLDDMAHAADVQSDEVALQPELASQNLETKGKKRTKSSASNGSKEPAKRARTKK